MVYHSQTGEGIDDGEFDTIAAISTPAGFGGIGVVRLSGPGSQAIAKAVAGFVPKPRQACYRRFDGGGNTVIDHGIVLYFPAPGSYTGEDVLEFQCHGGPVVLNLLLARVLDLGARTAEPGEFTRRAFLNGKMDLAQAEAVADLINSSTEAAAQCALRSLSGHFSDRVNAIMGELKNLRMFVEAAIDFPEEEIDFLDNDEIVSSVAAIHSQLLQLLENASRGRVLREGLEVAISGLPNAGKSSLLNQLAGLERSIVTPQAGTTRDTVDLMIDLDGLAIRLTDTAGLRESSDLVEQQGIERAWAAANAADLVLYLIDVTGGVSETDRRNLAQLQGTNVLVVWNKIDLQESLEMPTLHEMSDQVSISAKYATGLDSIREFLKRFVGFAVSDEGLFLARRRHLDAIQNALGYVNQAHVALDKHRSGELAAQDLRDAMDELGKLVGTVSADELLGEIFANFCIGK